MSHTWTAKDQKNLSQTAVTAQKRPRSDVGNKVTVVLGAQWGDEGKGKVVDLLATEADVVCRCQVLRFAFGGDIHRGCGPRVTNIRGCGFITFPWNLPLAGGKNTELGGTRRSLFDHPHEPC